MRKLFNNKMRWFTGCFLALCLGNTSFANAKSTYLFAVIPQYTPLQIYREWTPFVQYVSENSELKLTLKVYTSFKEFEKDLLHGEPDFVYLSPYHQILANKKQGYIPLVRDGSQQLVGILVTRADSGIQTLSDLKNQKIAFPSPTAFASSLYLRALLIEKENIQFQPVYAHSHTSVYRRVMKRRVKVGGGVIKTLAKQPAEIQDNLVIIYKAPGLASHPISAHPRISEQQRKIFSQLIMSMSQGVESKKILDNIQIMQPVQADQKKDYEFLDELGLEKYMEK